MRNKMKKKEPKIINVPRKPEEIEKMAEDIFGYLEHLCEDYDAGKTFAAVLIAVVLRTLLKSNHNTTSVLKHLGKENIPFVDSCAPRGGFRFWEFGDNICNHTFLTSNVYGGLLKKKVTKGSNGLVLDFEPLKDINRNINMQSLDEWYSREVVFENAEYKFTREDCINVVADKDGGAHLDKFIPESYHCFREPTALEIIIDGQLARFNQNPVYVSLRQIAWEVIESLK